MKIKKLLRTLLALSLFISVSSCADSDDEVVKEVRIISGGPVGIYENFPTETEDQMNVELAVNLDQFTILQDIETTWSVEKLKYDVKEYSLDIGIDETDDTGYYLEPGKNGTTAYVALYDEGSYRIKYSVTNFIDMKTMEFIIINGTPDYPELHVALNIPENDDDQSSDYTGTFDIEVGSCDTTSDLLSHTLATEKLSDGWFNTGIKINPMEPFFINAGMRVKKVGDKDGVIVNDPAKIISVKSGGSVVSVFNDQIDIDPASSTVISLVDVKRIPLNNLFYVVNYWGNDGKREYYKYKIDKVAGSDLPVYVKFDGVGVYLAKMFIGNIGVKVNDTDSFVYFTTDGVRTASVDPKIRRPYPGVSFGHLIGKLGIDGRVFPIGANFSYKITQDKVTYIYDGKKFVKDKK